MTLLDFDGDYGRRYNDRIELLIPGYRAMLELGAASLAAHCPQAQSVLVVGPGGGLELPGLLQALPNARFTLVEPSEQMRQQCMAWIEANGAGERINWGPATLTEADATAASPYDAVVCHNVLHVLEPEPQRQLLDQLARRVAPAGMLLLSSYSEPAGIQIRFWLEIAEARFKALGMDAPTVADALAARHSKVFPLDPEQLEQRLLLAGLEAPVQLLQSLCNRLWLCRRPSREQEPTAPESAAAALQQLIAVVALLRDRERGCPWDLEQTHASLLPFVLEEAHEVADAIRHGDDSHLAEELGDLLLQVVLHGQIAGEAGRFDLRQIARGISAKLIRRHPHVFAGDSDAVRDSWEAIKAREQAERAANAGGSASTSPLSDRLAGKVRGQPALAGAMAISKKAAAAGFEWDSMDGVWAKVHEELDELKQAVASGDKAHAQEELGDLLFTLVNVARWCGIDPETGLAGTNRRFLERFSRVETALGGELAGRSISELEHLWQQAKAAIRSEAAEAAGGG